MLCHHVLGHGYRNPALIAKMASTLQVLSGGRFMLGIGGGWREDEYRVVRLRLPADVGPTAPARGGRADLPADVDRGASDVPRASTSRSTTPPPPRAQTWCRRSASAPGEQVGAPDRRPAGRHVEHRSSRATTTGSASAAIVDAAAECGGRDPATIASCVTVAGDLPDSDAASEQWLERLHASHRARHHPRRVRLRPPARPRAGAAVRRAGDRTAPPTLASDHEADAVDHDVRRVGAGPHLDPAVGVERR